MRAQGLSINTVIVALIGLFILVILILVVSGKIRIFNFTTSSCATQGGACVRNSVVWGKADDSLPYEDQGCMPPRYTRITGTECDSIAAPSNARSGLDPAYTCCVSVVKDES